MTFTPYGFAARRLDEWLDRIRGYIVAEVGFEIDFSRDEVLGILTLAVADALSEASADDQGIVDGFDPDTATKVVLSKLSKIVGVERRLPSRSRYTFRAVSSDVARVYPARSILEGGGDDGRARWIVVDDTVIGLTPTALVVEARDEGPITMPEGGPTTLRKITTIPNVSVGYDPGDGDAFSVGRLAESDPELRVRRRQSIGVSGKTSHAGLRAALRALPWNRAATVTSPSAGRIAVVVSPAPADASQRAALASTIFEGTAYGIRWNGTETETVSKPDGTSDVVAWYEATTQAVAVVISGLTFASGVDEDEARRALSDEIVARFSVLDRGQSFRYLRAIGALDVVSGITGGSITLDGGTVDVSPADSTTLLVIDGDEPVFA